jgi:hypothetical protein
MARNRHIIRKTQPARYRRIDDQLWPLAVAMMVLGGFLAGSVLGYLRLDDPRWFANAWTWLIAIPLIIAAALVALAWTGNRLLRRTMQLSIVLGVIIHIVMFIAAAETDVFHRAWIEVVASADRPPRKKAVKVPDFMSWRHDPERRMRRDFERPVELRLPDPTIPKVSQEQTRPEPATTQPQARALPAPEDVPQPNVVKRAEPNQAAPRQRDEMSQLSRNEATVPSRPTQLVQLPSVVPRPPRREESPRPEEIGLRPQPRTRDQLRQPAHQPAEVLEVMNDVAALKQKTRAPNTRDRVDVPQPDITPDLTTARRDVEQPSPPREALAQTPRSIPNRQPRVTTRPDLTSVVDRVPESSAVAPAAPAAEPSSTTYLARVRDERMAATTPTPRQAIPETSTAENASPNLARRSPAATQPRTASVGAALPGRRPAEATALGSLSQRVSPVASEPGAPEPSRTLAGPAASANTNIAKQAAGNAHPELQRPSAETLGAVAVDQTPVRQRRRLPAASAPSLSALPDADLRPRRALRDATATSPLAVESPTRAASSADRAEASTEPASMALSKSELGTAGRGVSQNLGQADPSAASPALVASGSARRAQATQNVSPGPALGPQDAAIVRSGRAGEVRPSAVLEATPLSASLVAGARKPADVQASASAALAQAASDADRGDVTASKGDLDVDTGPTTLVAETGAGRGTGGGQPERSFGTLRATVPRAPPGQSPLPSLLADTTGATAAAPQEEGGGEPSAAEVDVDADSLLGARSGPNAGSFGGPRALGGGPSAVPTLSQAHSARRDHGVLDEFAQQESRGDVARLARKASQERQLPADVGVADLSAGNAADRDDGEVPSPSLAASAATVTSAQRATRGIAGIPGGQVDVPRDESSTAGAGSADLAARAEAVDAASGEPAVGGGTGSRPRAGRGPAVEAAAFAETVEIAVSPPSSGQLSAQPVDMQGPATTARSPSDGIAGRGTDVALVSGDPRSGPVSRLAGQALPADIEAPMGVGGLGSAATVEVGLATRYASEASTDVHLETARFNRNRVGGQPNLDTTAAMPTESFQRRIERAQGMKDPADGTGPQTEDAIELGLVFLSKSQLPDGRWSLDRFAKEDGLPQIASDSAATGLALLAFQGAGYNHLDFRYAEVVRRGIDFLLKNQQPDGSLFVAMDDESNRVVQFYSHSIAALAVCEAFGMTQDPMLRAPAQRAIDYIVETQNGQRGGWRYTRGVSSDTSVTGWMMMALKSGELANLEVPKETYRLIGGWLDSAQASASQPHLYCYNPFAPESAEQRAGRKPTATMTSVGLLMRLYLGWRRDNPAMARGAQYLAKLPPAIGTASNPQRDTYYWYYGTQVMFHMGGEYWRDWNRALHPLLVEAQIREGELAGSWDPQKPIPDRWAAFAGRLYVTTMNLLSLEVTYRHLPLYEETAK